MASASPHFVRGKLFQVEEGEEREGKRFCQSTKGTLVHRSDFADEPLRVEQARLREVGNRFTIIDLPEREVVAADARVPDQGELLGAFFLRGIWHIDAHFNPNDHKASLRIDQLFFSFVTRPSPYSHFACPLASRFIA